MIWPNHGGAFEYKLEEKFENFDDFPISNLIKNKNNLKFDIGHTRCFKTCETQPFLMAFQLYQKHPYQPHGLRDLT